MRKLLLTLMGLFLLSQTAVLVASTKNITIGEPGYQMQYYDLGQTNYYRYPSTVCVEDTPFVERWHFSASGGISAKSGDINGDGKVEVVFTDGAYLCALNGEGDEVLKIATTAVLGILADVTADGAPEIFLWRTDGYTGKIFVYDGAGTLIREFTSDVTPQRSGWPTSLSPYAVTDMDGDGDLGLLATKGAGYSLQPRGVVLFDYDTGTELWYHSIGPFPWWVAAVDVTGSLTREILFGSSGPYNLSRGADGTVDYYCYTFCLDSYDGSFLWLNQYEGYGFVNSSLAAADIDGDGNNEIVATSFSHGWHPWDGRWGRVYMLNPDNGDILQEHNLQKPVWMGGLGDLDNDGNDEIIVCEKNAGTRTSSVLAMDHSLNILNRFDVPGAHYITVQVITDINGDGYNEVIITNPIGSIAYVLDDKLDLLWSLPLPSGAGWPGSLFVSDLDSDGALELILQAQETLYVYSGELAVIPVNIDIKPGSCPNPLNVKSKGVLPVAVLGTEDFDVNAIDVASVRLEGVAPIRSDFEDVAAPVQDGNECECTTERCDGYLDLTLKFETEEIVDALGEVVDGEELVLTVTGMLYDETPIQGEDCILVISKKGRGTGE